jgi:hypothetical protein
VKVDRRPYKFRIEEACEREREIERESNSKNKNKNKKSEVRERKREREREREIGDLRFPREKSIRIVET